MDPQCNNHRLYAKGLASSDVKVNVQDNDGDRAFALRVLQAKLAVGESAASSRCLHGLRTSRCTPLTGKPLCAFLFRSKPSRVRFHARIRYHGDPWGNRTPVTGVRGRCLNRLTNGPHFPTGSSVCWCTIRDSNPGPTD